MKYDKDFIPMEWRPDLCGMRTHERYNSILEHSLHFLSEIFFIESLVDNKRPMDGKEYITVDENSDTMTIRSLFSRYNDYVIPRLSVVDLNGKLFSVYKEEIEYLKDRFINIGNVYMDTEFKVFHINCFAYDGLFSAVVDIRDPFKKSTLSRRYKTTLGMIAESGIVNLIAHEVFDKIRSALLDQLDKERKELLKMQLNSVYGMSGGDFDGDVLAKVEFTNCVKGFGVPESVVDTKEHAAEYERVMAAIRSTSGNYKGGYMRDYTSMYGKAIKKVIFNDPATVVMWNDGTKTVVKKHGDVEFNGEAAVMYAYVLRWHFNNNRKSMRIWLKQNAKRFEWQSEEPKKITVTRTSKGKITKASQKEIYEAMTPEQKEVVDAMIQDAVKGSKKASKSTKKVAEVKNEDTK